MKTVLLPAYQKNQSAWARPWFRFFFAGNWNSNVDKLVLGR